MLFNGFKAMIPITAGIIPFGMVMGSAAQYAKLNLLQTLLMNVFVFAGTAQLAAIELMLQDASSLVVIATGLIINLRFILYSAAFSPFVHNANVLLKAFCAQSLTDQTYTVLRANEHQLGSKEDALRFYIGASICMIIAWQGAVILGFIFGNITPESIALEYAVPLSFIALVIPTLKNRNYIIVALAASVLGVVLRPLPYNLGLLTAALSAIGLGALLTRKKIHAN